MEFVANLAVGRVRCREGLDEWRRRLGIVAGVLGFPGWGNNYDRGLLEGQRPERAQGRTLRQARLTHRGMTKKRPAHDERGKGGARAAAGKIALITTMRPALQWAH